MLFGRGQWAIVGLKPESAEKFDATLQSEEARFRYSQFAADVVTRTQKRSAMGINPFQFPRRDEEFPESLDLDALDEINAALQNSPRDGFKPENFADAYGTAEQFLLDKNTAGNVYAFWFVLNDYDDVTDVASKKEAVSYAELHRPYKFTVKDDKKFVDGAVQATTVAIRKQFPVIVDFQSKRVYIASSNKDEVLAVREFLQKMGAETLSLYWDFDGPMWVEKFLNKCYEQSRFMDDFSKRAEERKQFKASEIEKLEDKMLERIVTNFFSMTEMPNGLWAGLSTPASIKIYKEADPIGCGEPTTVTALMKLTNTQTVVTANLTIQELIARTHKNGTESFIRHDLLTMDLNHNMNLMDAGAAMLRGFDLPRFKNQIKQMLKDRATLDIPQYWYQWLSEMRGAIETFVDSVTETLELDEGGLQEFSEGANTSIEEIKVEGL